MSEHALKAISLREATEALSRLPGHLPVVTTNGEPIAGVGSYRGYYEQLALEPQRYDRESPMSVADLLGALKRADGATFQGYKGGAFVMDGRTPMWVSPHGETSDDRLCGFLPTADSVIAITVNLGGDW